MNHQTASAAARTTLAFLLILLAVANADAQPQEPLIHYEDPAENPVLRLEQGPNLGIIDLLPAQDTFITSGQPNTVWGSSDMALVGYDLDTGRGAERIYVQFDLGYVPGSIEIHSATLFWYQWAATPAGDAPMPAEMRHLNGPWSSNTLTWANATAPWGGVVYSGQISTAIGWRTLDVTSLVLDWVNGVRPNYGLLVQGDEQVQERERAFYSRDATNGLRPFLRIDFTYTGDITPPTAQVTTFDPPITDNPSFTVAWTGEDDPNGTGIEGYDIQVRVGQGPWQLWLSGTTATSQLYTATEGDNTYEFEARATDMAGNVEPFHNVSEAGIILDAEAPFVEPRLWLPLAMVAGP
jgi:hypothetical protein